MKKVKLSKARTTIGLILITGFFMQSCRKETIVQSASTEQLKTQEQGAIDLKIDLSIYDCDYGK